MTRIRILAATLFVALALAATAESASAALVYRGVPALSTVGSVTYKSTALWNVYRLQSGTSTVIGTVAQVSAQVPRFNVYRGSATAGYVVRGLQGRYFIYRRGIRVGYTQLMVGRWYVYRGTARIGSVGPGPGGPAAGAALLLLI